MSMCKCDCGEMSYPSRAEARRAASRLEARTQRHFSARVFGEPKTAGKKRGEAFHGRKSHPHSLISECEYGGLHVSLEKRELSLV